VRRLVTWAALTAAVAGVLRWLRHRGRDDEKVAAEPDHAEELRRKLAEARAEEQEAPPVPEATVDERRAEVHEQGRAALDEMNRPGEG